MGQKRAHGTGSVEQISEGVFRARVRANGKLRSLRDTFASIESAEDALLDYYTDPNDAKLSNGNPNREISNRIVYFVRCTSGLIKIGSSTDVVHRLRVMQTGSAETLTLIATKRGNADLEKLLHRHFKKERVRGEWFTPSERLLSYIRKNTQVVTDESLTPLTGVL